MKHVPRKSKFHPAFVLDLSYGNECAVFVADTNWDIFQAFVTKHLGHEYTGPRGKGGFTVLIVSLPLRTIEKFPLGLGAGGAMRLDRFIDFYENEFLPGYKELTIIKHIPHASLTFPRRYQYEETRTLVFGKRYKEENIALCDLYVDRFFSKIEGIEIKAPYTRLYCDSEKFLDDDEEPMAKLGQGHLYTKSIYGYPFKRNTAKGGPDEHADVYYQIFHAQVDAEVRHQIEQGKSVLFLDLHSYSDAQARRAGKKGPFPDICIGVKQGYYDYRILSRIVQEIERQGYSYAFNYPYEGTFIPDGVLNGTIYGDITCIMLEVNKRVYLEKGEKGKKPKLKGQAISKWVSKRRNGMFKKHGLSAPEAVEKKAYAVMVPNRKK